MKHSYGLILTDSFITHLKDLEKSGWLCGENGSGTMHGIVGGFRQPNLPGVCQDCRKEADRRENQPTSETSEESGRILYAATAQIIPFPLPTDGWASNGLQIPTFYLDPSVQGIVDETHAKIIARSIVDPYHIYHLVEITIARVPASVMLRP